MIRKLFPPQVIDSYEVKYHMGNYVIDRNTGEKSFESMSIYVRVGMHLLYYGTEQEKALHWKRTLELLKKQSEKMGQQYDSLASKAHIIPFIQAFHLRSFVLPSLYFLRLWTPPKKRRCVDLWLRSCEATAIMLLGKPNAVSNRDFSNLLTLIPRDSARFQ